MTTEKSHPGPRDLVHTFSTVPFSPSLVDVGVGGILGVEKRLSGCFKGGSEQGNEIKSSLFYVKEYFIIPRKENTLKNYVCLLPKRIADLGFTSPGLPRTAGCPAHL